MDSRVHRLDAWSSAVLLPALLISALVLLAVAPAALAGGVGKWTNLTGATGTNLTQVGLLVTPDGLLHVAWTGKSATPDKDALYQRAVKGSGAFVASRRWSRRGRR